MLLLLLLKGPTGCNNRCKLQLGPLPAARVALGASTAVYPVVGKWHPLLSVVHKGLEFIDGVGIGCAIEG